MTFLVCSPSKQRSIIQEVQALHLRRDFSEPQLCNYQTMMLCLWDLIGKSYVTVRAHGECLTLKQVFRLCTFLPLFLQNDTEERWHFVSVEAKEKVSAGRVQCPCKMINGMGHFLLPHPWASQKCWETITLRPGQSKEPSSQLVSFHLLTHRIPSWMCF